MTEGEFKEHLDAAEKNPRQLAAATSGLPPETLRYKPAPDKWSILEILGHLADVEIMYGHRIRQILADENPVIAPIDQNAWAANLGYMETPAPEMIALFGVNRHHNLRILRRVKAQDLNKSAYHPELKRDVHLSEMVEKLDSHTQNHLRQIETIKRKSK
jgi:hypothetical protein